MIDGTTTLDRTAFAARFGGIYEHSSWVAERTLEEGKTPGFLNEQGRDPAGELRSRAEAHALGAAMASTLARATDAEKRSLILAHPDLVGHAAQAGELTDESMTEQSSAGLDQCTAEELERFQVANASYRTRFGFPFIMAVRGADRHSILEAFEKRLKNEKPVEFETALVEINRIALLRLEALVRV